MLLLRLTSGDSVVGAVSDDGFQIGRFTVGDTLNLLLATAFLGALVGLFYAFARTVLPQRHRVVLYAVPVALLGSAGLVHADGVDFTILSPRWLAVTLFVALPTAGAFGIALAVEWLERHPTALPTPVLAVLSLLGTLALLPFAIFAPIIVLVGRVDLFRSFQGARWSQALAVAVCFALAAVGLLNTVQDSVEIL